MNDPKETFTTAEGMIVDRMLNPAPVQLRDSSDVKVEVLDSHSVMVLTRFDSFELSAQEAYDLWCALHAILPQLQQPFQPYPR